MRNRDPDAMAAFFDRYFDSIFGLVYRLLGNRTAAEDVTQEVFYKVYRAAHQLDPARDPGPWVTAIAYNACRDVWRSGAHRLSKRSTSVDDTPGLAEKLTSGTNDPERDLITAERKKLVLDAIQQLPENLRDAVVLFEYEGLGHQEIAEIMGVNHAAARKRYSRALEALGKILKEKLA